MEAQDKESTTPNQRPTAAGRSAPRRKEITPELITAALTDYYHNDATDAEVQRRHGISRQAWIDIRDTHGEKFVAKFGRREKVSVSELDMESYWKDANIGPAPKIVTSNKRGTAADAAGGTTASAPPPAAKPPAAKGRPRKQ